MSHTLSVDQTSVEKFVRETCNSCSITFFVPESFSWEAKNRGRWFHCPNGHQQHYAETEEQRLRKQIDNLQQRTSSLQESVDRQRRLADLKDRQLAAHRGLVTRLKKRVAAGVCPCCSKRFEDVGKHMAERHPGFGASGEAAS